MNKFIKDLGRVLSSNLIGLLVGIVNGFLVPGFLGINEYAALKTYSLYAGYVGILHLGFLDGIYLKYGGVNSSKVDRIELKSELRFVIYSQFFITLFFCCFSLVLHDWILLAVSISILPKNLLTFFSFYYQALGEFNKYAKINSVVPVIRLLLICIAVFLIKTPDANIFIGILIIVPAGVSFVLAIKQIYLMNDIPSYKIFSKNNFHLVKIGIFIMVGNLASALFFSMDRWFVKILLSVTDFALYAFAISLLNLILIFISSIAMTFYPLLVNNQGNDSLIGSLKNIMIIIGSISMGGYFILSMIIRGFLPEYTSSLYIISFLFLALPPITVINTIYINLYKARKEEKKYSFTVIVMVVISIIANGIAVFISKTGESISMATVISFYLWFIYSSKDFQGTKITIKEHIYLVFVSIMFFISSRFVESDVLGLFYFEGVVFLITFLFFKESLKNFYMKLKKI
jgi:O-antigen/teichoic acid export membrane protein